MMIFHITKNIAIIDIVILLKYKILIDLEILMNFIF